MKICIHELGKRFNIVLPTVFINAPTLRFILRKTEVEIDDKFNAILPKLCKAVRRFHAHHRRFVLIEIISKDNEHIKITL